MNAKSYSLKCRNLEIWLVKNGYTHAELASILRIPVEMLYRKLWEHKSFSKKQIYRLVILLTAKEAVKVIYFPTIAERALAYQLVFEV